MTNSEQLQVNNERIDALTALVQTKAAGANTAGVSVQTEEVEGIEAIINRVFELQAAGKHVLALENRRYISFDGDFALPNIQLSWDGTVSSTSTVKRQKLDIGEVYSLSYMDAPDEMHFSYVREGTNLSSNKSITLRAWDSSMFYSYVEFSFTTTPTLQITKQSPINFAYFNLKYPPIMRIYYI